MPFEKFSRPDARFSCPTTTWVRLGRSARLGLGGIMIGSFLGVYAGAAVGLVYAAWVSQLSATWDGALLGGFCCAVLGGVYGTVLGWTERPSAGAVLPNLRHQDREVAPNSVSSTQVPPAGTRCVNRSPEREHAHVR